MSSRDRRPAADVPPFDHIAARCGPALLRFCIVQAGSQRAEDVFQETMLAALRAYDSVRDAASIKPWLFSIAARKAVDAHRAAVRSPKLLPESDRHVARQADPARSDPAAMTLDEELWAQVGALPDKQRHAVGLRFLADLSHRRIAQAMQTSEAAARRNVFEGLERLRSNHRPQGAVMTAAATTSLTADIRGRVDGLDWPNLRSQLDDQGHAITKPLLRAGECDDLIDLFDDDSRFRSTIDMARYRFGDGRYRYFDHPLPEAIAALRASFYRHLAPIANDWAQLLRGDNPTFPPAHDELLGRCHQAGQQRPTPLILRYHKGDWNALHQDLYGKVFFPFQILTMLARPEKDFTGGELVLLEQRPRAQSRAHVLRPDRGAFVIFPTKERPNKGTNGYHRVGMRHGVATVTGGQRTAMGVIFHDAK